MSKSKAKNPQKIFPCILHDFDTYFCCEVFNPQLDSAEREKTAAVLRETSLQQETDQETAQEKEM